MSCTASREWAREQSHHFVRETFPSTSMTCCWACAQSSSMAACLESTSRSLRSSLLRQRGPALGTIVRVSAKLGTLGSHQAAEVREELSERKDRGERSLQAIQLHRTTSRKSTNSGGSWSVHDRGRYRCGRRAEEWIEASPAAGMQELNVGEWRAWTDEECKQFEARWAPCASLSTPASARATLSGWHARTARAGLSASSKARPVRSCGYPSTKNSRLSSGGSTT